jgi:hypothetical protein
MVIGICGYARSGKSTVAEIIRDRMRAMGRPEPRIVPFAKPIKTLACDSFGWTGLKDAEGRRLLQDLGETGRRYSPDMWVTRWLCGIARTHGPVIADDLRYRNEQQVVREPGLCGTILRVTRPATDPGWLRERAMRCGLLRSHPSERPWLLTPDHTIVNDGTIDDLVRRVAGWMETQGIGGTECNS